MEYSEFLNVCHSVYGKTMYANEFDYYGNTDTVERIGIKEDHISGGASGGNCWGDHAVQYINDTPDTPNFDQLDELFDQVCPEITFRKHRKVINDIVYKETTYGFDEYYGNYTRYKRFLITFKDIYNALDKHEVF